MRKDTPFAPGETYHIFNRGAHKQNIFTAKNEYDRFVLLLYLANTRQKIELRPLMRRYQGQTSVIFEQEKIDKDLVSVMAYCLMPNHFHLVLQEKVEGGITKFMRKVLTAYSMYFNLRHQHSGILAQGAMKSRHINNEPYFRYIFSYVHLNPLGYKYPEWEKQGIKNILDAEDFLASYEHSSFVDYTGRTRPQGALLDIETAPEFLKTQNDFVEMVRGYDQGLTLVIGDSPK